MRFSDLTAKVIGDKRRWWAYKARVKQLPASYRTAVEGLERYLMIFGATDGDGAASMFEDLADLFDRAAADQTPIREIVGEDPVEFIDAFIQNYRNGGWINRERERLTSAIERAIKEEGSR